MMRDNESPIMTVEECARYLRIARGHAYEMVREGKIPHLRLGRKILIPRQAVERLLEGAVATGGSAVRPQGTA